MDKDGCDNNKKLQFIIIKSYKQATLRVVLHLAAWFPEVLNSTQLAKDHSTTLQRCTLASCTEDLNFTQSSDPAQSIMEMPDQPY